MVYNVMVALARQRKSGAEIRDKNNQADLMFDEYIYEFDKILNKEKRQHEIYIEKLKTKTDINEIQTFIKTNRK